MARVEVMSPEAETAAFVTIAAARATVREAFCRLAFAPKVLSRLLDRLEGQRVRFDYKALRKIRHPSRMNLLREYRARTPA